MKWPAGARKGNRSSCCHGSRCIAILGIINDTKITTHLYPIGFSGVGVGSEWAPFYTISHFFWWFLCFSSQIPKGQHEIIYLCSKQPPLLNLCSTWQYFALNKQGAPLSNPFIFYRTSSFTHFLIIGSICCKMAQLFCTSHAHALLHTLSVPGQHCSEGMWRQS